MLANLRHRFRRLREIGRALRSLDRLTHQVHQQEQLLQQALHDRWSLWLYLNRAERMDATLELFSEGRRRFHLARYEFAARYAAGTVAADIACGTGYGTLLLKTAGAAAAVTGVDIDSEAIGYARHCKAAPGVTFVCQSGDATGLPAAHFDLIASFETVEHVPDDVRLLEEFHRLLKPGGRLIISTPNDWPVEASPHHLRSYSAASFRELLGRRFEFESLHNQNSGNGAYNHGQPAGITPTTATNHALAECLIAVVRKPSHP